MTSSFPRDAADHAGSFVRGFARAMVRCGHHVDVLAPEPADDVRPPSEPGIDVHHVPYFRPRAWQRTFYGAGAPENLGRDPRAWLGVLPFALAMRRAVAARAQRWDAVVSHWALPGGLLAGHVLGPTECEAVKPHLVVCHSADVHVLDRIPGGAWVARAVTERASSLLFVSADLRDRWLSMLGPIGGAQAAVRCHVSPMGIERPSEATCGRREARRSWRMTRFTIVTLGRLVPVKGLDVLLDATAGRKDLEVIVAGEGPERARLERLAARRGVNCRFVGVVHGDAKQRLLAGADVMAVPSRVLPSGRTEGTPVAMLEGMRAGLPVIASAVGGIASLVERRGAALLVEPDDAGELARAIDALRRSADVRRRIARAGCAVARSLEWDRLAGQLLRLIAPVLPPTAHGATDARLWGTSQRTSSAPSLGAGGSYGAPPRS
ncbi:MAG: glycosyltransferase family 4 protein [Deltaproteobacteria bacterium]|nr:glycosyltransferase family 4 protein [Deltaproteobacteria bacterium]